MSDNFTPEQIAADREINGKATPGPAILEVFSDGGWEITTPKCGQIARRGRWLHKVEESHANAALFFNARTRFPLALDEIERLRAERDKAQNEAWENWNSFTLLQAEFAKMDLLGIAAESEVDQQDT